jgi:hypothetical protein
MKAAELEKIAEKSKTVAPCSSPRGSVHDGDGVAKVVLAWTKLPASIRAAILALVDAGTCN